MGGFANGRRPRVGVLMGGPGGERDVSLASGWTVLRSLRGSCSVKPIDLRPDGLWAVGETWFDAGGDEEPVAPLVAPALTPAEAARCLLDDGVDIVFNALHGPPGEDGTVQGFLRLQGLAFTGPEGTAAAVTMDKRLTKLGMIAAGIPTPPFFAVPAAEFRAGGGDWEARLEAEVERTPLPWVFKPSRLGSSVGIEFLRSRDDVIGRAAAVLGAWPDEARRDALLVESAISGRELSCAVVETTAGAVRALPPIELRPRHGGFFDYEAKYTPGATEELCPAPLPAATRAAVEELSVRVHRLFECAPLSRTDLFLVEDERLLVLEINTLPGMTETSLVPLAARTAGIALDELLFGVVDHGLCRARSSAPVACRSRSRAEQ